MRIAVSRADSHDPQQHVLLNPYGVIGRSPNCDIRLKDSQVSFRHAYLQMIGGRLFCADLGSRSGTHWSAAQHRAGWLSADDDVSIGPYLLRLVEDPAADGGDRLAIPTDVDPLAIYDGQLGELPDVRLEFLNAADDVDLPLRRMLTFAGSARGCKLRFEGDRISRVHCSLLLTPSGLWIIDLLGKGGTKVNGSLVRSDRLNDGDVLKIGQFQMRVHYDGSGEKPFSGVILPPETSVETSSSTDEELPKTPRDEGVLPHPSLELSESQEDTGNHCGRLVDELVVNKLLTREKIDEVLAGFAGAIPTFDQLSDRLVELQLISQWQADQLATDNHGPLILENRYQLVGRLGYGSMGNVYLAFDEALQSKVAIKIPHHSLLSNERLFKRFRRETLISANLVHSHIVRALNIGRGNQFVVLELVDGDDLRDLMDRQGPPDTMMAVDFLIQVAEAVDFARSEGVVHRDIKPSNILISRDGTAKLFDFGLAHLDDNARKKGVAGRDAEFIPTRQGFAVGTVQYMSPEQARESDDVDTRSDIYSLGCTFYEILTGSPPFEGENQHQILKQHAQDPMRPIEGLDPVLAEILEKMLAKDPEQRIQTPRELIDSLRCWQTAALAEEETDTEETDTTEAEIAEQAQLAEHEEQLRRFEQERADWQQAIAEQRQEVEREREEWRAELEREQDELRSRQASFDRRQAELEEQEQVWTSQAAELEQRQEQAAEVEEQLQLQQQAVTAERAKIEDDLATITAKRETLEKAAAELESACVESEERRGLLEFQHAELTERRDAFEHLINDHDVATREMARDRDGADAKTTRTGPGIPDAPRTTGRARKSEELTGFATRATGARSSRTYAKKRGCVGASRDAGQGATSIATSRSRPCRAIRRLGFCPRVNLPRSARNMQSERTDLDARRTALAADLRAFQADAEQFQTEKELLQQQREELIKSTSDVEQEFARLNAERQKLAEERTQLTADSAALQNRTQKLKIALAEWFDE